MINYTDYDYECGCKKSHPKNYILSFDFDGTICDKCKKPVFIKKKENNKYFNPMNVDAN